MTSKGMVAMLQRGPPAESHMSMMGCQYAETLRPYDWLPQLHSLFPAANVTTAWPWGRLPLFNLSEGKGTLDGERISPNTREGATGVGYCSQGGRPLGRSDGPLISMSTERRLSSATLGWMMADPTVGRTMGSDCGWNCEHMGSATARSASCGNRFCSLRGLPFHRIIARIRPLREVYWRDSGGGKLSAVLKFSWDDCHLRTVPNTGCPG